MGPTFSGAGITFIGALRGVLFGPEKVLRTVKKRTPPPNSTVI